VELTRARNVGGATQIFENPQYSTAIGLTKYAMAVTRDSVPQAGMFERIAQGLGGIFRKRSR